MHAETFWTCDFITKKAWKLGGAIDYFVLSFIHLGTRQAIAYRATASPTGGWTAQ